MSFNCFRLFFDGGCNRQGTAAGGGWVLYGAVRMVDDAPEEWTKMAELSFPLGDGCTVTVAELEACLWGVCYLSALLECDASVAEHLNSWRPLDTKRFRVLELSGRIL